VEYNKISSTWEHIYVWVKAYRERKEGGGDWRLAGRRRGSMKCKRALSDSLAPFCFFHWVRTTIWVVETEHKKQWERKKDQHKAWKTRKSIPSQMLYRPAALIQRSEKASIKIMPSMFRVTGSVN
jgi:hypothetical protein